MDNPKESFADWLDSSRCAEILREERWPDGQVKCPYCNSRSVKKLEVYQEDFYRYQCMFCSEKSGKKKTFNDKTMTIFEGSKLPITKWFYGISLLQNKVSDLGLAKELQVDKNTARRMSVLIKASVFFDSESK